MPGFDANAQETLAHDLKQQAQRIGFDACGITEAVRLDNEARILEKWLMDGRHATMQWMENHFEKRVDPRELVQGARTVVSLLHSYYQPREHVPSSGAGKISRYAWGDDYHEVLKEKLAELYDWLDTRVGGVSGRIFVDSAPVLDKVWAQRAGLGWIGKHTNLISREIGSYFFVAEMIVDVPIAPDAPFSKDYCGSCTRCIDACPTDAIHQPYAVDSNRCISYWTIEHREDDVPDDLARDFGTWIFGCDICQDVCPWNKFRQPTRDSRFLPREGIADTDLQEWVELSIEEYRKRFKRSPVKRARFEGFQRNVRIALKNAEREDA
ncbi:MAG: tRNA epoxyqueuosine(34) reductase QueG [Rubricoccaceae bacterium]|nr:tRNA epoxyqueuosine(34) reductase QueG [Rubricoccaceae bacterium]